MSLSSAALGQRGLKVDMSHDTQRKKAYRLKPLKNGSDSLYKQPKP